MTIGLKVDTPTSGAVHAGSILYGRIYLSVKQETGNKNIGHSIRLKVVGTETVELHHTTTESIEGRTNTRDHYERASHTIYSIDHPMKEFPNGKIPRGQYEFPFALQLPESLPSSMSATKGQSECRVRYEVVAEIFQEPNSLLHTNPHAKENLNVLAIAPVATSADTSLQLPKEVIPINDCACCCFACSRQGTLALETKFERTVLLLDASMRQSENNTATVRFRCDNKSTKQFQRVKVDLVETIEWSVNGHSESVRKTLASATQDASIFPELDRNWRKPFRWEEHVDDGQALLLHHNPWRTIGLSLSEISSKATDTYKGRYATVRHVLVLKLISDGCCATNPEESALVEIFRAPAPVTAAASPPSCCGEASPNHSKEAYPSAPFEEEYPSTVPASAPSDLYDDHSYGVAPTNKVPMVEARLVNLLPEDWNAQTADLVTIPIAHARVLDRN